MSKILVIDDDRAVVQLVMDALARGNELSFATDGAAALHQIVAEQPGLVMLDLMMPGMDGALLLPLIRRISRAPIIVLSGRHEQADIVGALNAGADDVISKPFDLDDLEARVGAVLKRSTSRGPVPDDALRSYTAGPLTLAAMRTAKFGDDEIQLTATEQKILLVLTRYADRIVPRGMLYAEVWGMDDPTLSKTLDNHVRALRNRLAALPGAPSIVTVRNKGFMLQPLEGTTE